MSDEGEGELSGHRSSQSALAMEGTVGFATKAGVFQGMGVGPCAMHCCSRDEGCVVALLDKVAIEECCE